jgi:hypothetical protein
VGTRQWRPAISGAVTGRPDKFIYELVPGRREIRPMRRRQALPTIAGISMVLSWR